jgi:hypothetical protein
MSHWIPLHTLENPVYPQKEPFSISFGILLLPNLPAAQVEGKDRKGLPYGPVYISAVVKADVQREPF